MLDLNFAACYYVVSHYRSSSRFLNDGNDIIQQPHIVPTVKSGTGRARWCWCVEPSFLERRGGFVLITDPSLPSPLQYLPSQSAEKDRHKSLKWFKSICSANPGPHPSILRSVPCKINCKVPKFDGGYLAISLAW